MLPAALDLVEHGVSVIALRPRGKLPRGDSHGWNDASTDVDVVRGWWGDEPDANVGIVTGLPGGLIVVDVDSYKRSTADDLARLVGSDLSGCVAITGRGGRHYYYRLPPGETRRSTALDAIDVKAQGGYVLAPPSIVRGADNRRLHYSWAPDSLMPWEAPLAPASLLSLAAKPEPSIDQAGGKRHEILIRSPEYALLLRAGMVLRLEEDKNEPAAKALVPCPRSHEHGTDTRPTHSFLFVADDGKVAFQCHHGSCASIFSRMDELLKIAGQRVSSAEDVVPFDVPAVEPSVEREPGEDAEEEDEPEEPGLYVPITRLEVPEAEPYLWKGYVAPGALTILHAPPKAGKTTLLAYLCRAMHEGAVEFLGTPIASTPVLFCSEEGEQNWIQRREDIGLGSSFYVYARPHFGIWPEWEMHLDTVLLEAERARAQLVVFDTSTGIAPIENENDNAEMVRFAKSLAKLTNRGLAVVLTAHSKKDSDAGGVGAMRGASSFAGAADVIMQFSAPGDSEDTRRTIQATGRLPDTVAVLQADFDAGEWVVRSRKHSPLREKQIRTVLEAFATPTTPDEAFAHAKSQMRLSRRLFDDTVREHRILRVLLTEGDALWLDRKEAAAQLLL